jgi:NADPH-dependent 2,4-dienoyl-CoA reductase/sulfur reductase-like enzyme
LRSDLALASRVVVIGAGFIGAEVAASCRSRGLEVTVLDAAQLPHENAIGPEMAEACIGLHREHGVRLRLGVTVAGFAGVDHVTGVELDTRELLPADVVVVGVGVLPATDWLKGSGVCIDNGVVCDERLRVLDERRRPLTGVVAAGDVCRFPGFDGALARVEHWDNAVAQGEAAARTLLEADLAPAFAEVPYFWSDQYGIKIQFVGRYRQGDRVEVVDGSVEAGRFSAEYRRDGQLVGAFGFDRASRIMRYRRSIADRATSASEATNHKIGVR